MLQSVRLNIPRQCVLNQMRYTENNGLRLGCKARDIHVVLFQFASVSLNVVFIMIWKCQPTNMICMLVFFFSQLPNGSATWYFCCCYFQKRSNKGVFSLYWLTLERASSNYESCHTKPGTAHTKCNSTDTL